MKELRVLFCLLAAILASNVLNAQNYVKDGTGETIMTISSSNKIYLGEGFDSSMLIGQVVGNKFNMVGEELDCTFKQSILYVDGEGVLKTVGGKTYVVGEDEPEVIRKGNKVYSSEGDLIFSTTAVISDKMQSALLLICLGAVLAQ